MLILVLDLGQHRVEVMDQKFEKRLLRQQNGQSFLTPTCSPSVSPIANRNQPRSLPASPGGLTPTKDRCGDRFIPSRAGARWHIDFNLLSENSITKTKSSKNQQQQQERPPNPNRKPKDACENGKDSLMYQCLLKNELLGAEIQRIKDCQSEDRRVMGSPCSDKKNLFKYSVRMKRADATESSPYSLSPVGAKSQRLLRSPRKPMRKISKIPFKVLDAPELQDDFYLNLVDWSSSNILSVGLGTCVYLWSAHTSQVTRLCDLTGDGDSVTSVNWNDRGNLVAVGTHKGYVQVWDVATSKQITQLQGHSARVGALAWNGEQLSSGSRDRLILQRDIKSANSGSSSGTPDRKLVGHKQEVCGLKWSPDKQHLASGGNDNKLLVWSASCSGGNSTNVQPVHTYSEHLAAVKAIAWSPHQHGLLASGGGTADRCIRFWNTLTQQPLQCVDTGSQVCNLAWSKHANELVSTHGYSQNQILLWKYPSLTQVAKLTGHSYRVLYLAASPDGEAIVTGAGDETLRFWNVFSKARTNKESTSVLNLFTRIR